MQSLGDLLPVDVVLARGTRRVMVTATDLEKQLAIPGLASKLAEILRHTETGSVERGLRGASRNSSASLDANADRNLTSALALAPALGVKDGSGEPSGGTTPNSSVDNDGVERLALHLATKLCGRDAPEHLAFYRLVARTVPREIALDALTRALDAHDIRKSRAHLFAYLVRPHLPRRSLT